jgi:hypothetical protein
VKIDLPEEYAPLVIDALEHYYAYTRAKQQEDLRYNQVAEWFRAAKKGPTREIAGANPSAGFDNLPWWARCVRDCAACGVP